VNVAVVIATCGEQKWADLAWERAQPSADEQEPRPQIVVRHYPELTVAEARNALARDHTTADWLCFLDADDELEPGYLAAMSAVEWGTHGPTNWTEPPLLIPYVRFVRGGRSLEEARIPNKGGWPRVNEAVIGTLVHRRLFEQVGGFRTRIDCESCGGGGWGCRDCEGTGGTALTIYEDWDLWLRCVDAGAQRIYVKDAVYRAHVNRDGRNIAADPHPVYDAIWNDHMRRTA
jgi:hypothetical protein